MTGLTITGRGLLGPAGAADTAGMSSEPLPTGQAPVLADFDVRAHLGRKGTSFYDRVTALAVVACDAALRDGDVSPDPVARARIGVALGTTVGSFKSTSDYTRETLVQERPYLVNPVLFPNTIMNCAAGQAAIRFGLRGVNATIAGGPIAFHSALRYAANALRRGDAATMLVGAAEEYSPHRAWNAHLAATGVDGAPRSTLAAEGAAVFVVERSDGPQRPGAVPVAEIPAIATAFGWGDAAGPALAGCVRRVLAAAGVEASEVSLVLTGESGLDDVSEYGPATEALGRRPERVALAESLGRCDAATAALGLAHLLDRFESAAGSAQTALLTARTPEGGVAAALVRGLG